MAMELLGNDGDETRILVHRESGWSVALVGRPRLVVADASALPRYDVIVALDDVNAEHGFRMDHAETQIAPPALAASFALAYGTNRASGAPRVHPFPARVPGGEGGAHAIYPLRESATDPRVEQIVVLVRGPWALHHTTRFRTDDLNHIQWAHLRTATLHEHRWEPRDADAPPKIWPASMIALPSAKLDLTEEGWSEAVAKAKECGHVEADVTDRIVGLFRDFAMSDPAPSAEIPEPMVNLLAGRVRMAIPAPLASVLVRNASEVKTFFDLRAWSWQCVWAVGNRRLYA